MAFATTSAPMKISAFLSCSGLKPKPMVLLLTVLETTALCGIVVVDCIVVVLVGAVVLVVSRMVVVLVVGIVLVVVVVSAIGHTVRFIVTRTGFQ